MSKNSQYINKPILVTNDIDTVDLENVSHLIQNSTDSMLTEYNEITKYMDETECMKSHSLLVCSHSIDKDIKSFNMAKLSSKDCDILHVKSPLAKMVLIKEGVILHRREAVFQNVHLGMMRIPKPAMRGAVSKGKCVKRKKNIVKA
ncbi:hypothetical protein ACO0OL_000259 [Hanseniaspora opuntiae]